VEWGGKKKREAIKRRVDLIKKIKKNSGGGIGLMVGMVEDGLPACGG
jgi:hypothetical protein